MQKVKLIWMKDILMSDSYFTENHHISNMKLIKFRNIIIVYSENKLKLTNRAPLIGRYIWTLNQVVYIITNTR
jgi:hypothetical protein